MISRNFTMKLGKSSHEMFDSVFIFFAKQICDRLRRKKLLIFYQLHILNLRYLFVCCQRRRTGMIPDSRQEMKTGKFLY